MSEILSGSMESVAVRLAEYEKREIDAVLSEHDDMLSSRTPQGIADYMAVGRSAVANIAQALLLAGSPKIDSVLDMACGYGRVLRHLVALFPEARIVACDLYTERVEFCTRSFGVEGVLGCEDPGDLRFPRRFDLIWCGSLLTHLPWIQFVHTLQLFARSLSPRGLAVVTVHGRFANVQQARSPYLPAERFETIQTELGRSGFGYADYEDLAIFPRQRRYGISVVLPSHLTRIVEGLPDVRLLGYRERGWDDHHDVVVFGRPAIHSLDGR